MDFCRILVYLSCLFLYIACASTSSNVEACYNKLPEASPIIPAQVLGKDLKHVTIKTDELYYKHFDYAYSNENSWLILINEKNKSLEIYNLDSSKRIFLKKLEEFGIDFPELGFSNGIEFISFDSIFLASETSVWLIDTQSIKNEFVLPYTKHNGNTLRLYNLDHAPMRFDACSEQLLFQSYATSLPVSSKKYYSIPLTAGMETNTGQIFFYSMTYPPLYQNNYYGFANLVFRSVEGCKSYYSFPADSRGYVLDHVSNKVISFCATSSYDNGAIKLIKKSDKDDTELKLNAMIQMPFYMAILPDPFRNQYFRFFLAPLSENKQSGDYNTWADKELILMVLNETFTCEVEYSLGVNVYSYFRCFVGKEGLYLSRHFDNTQDTFQHSLEFDIFR